MINTIAQDIFKLKKDLLDEISEHLPASAREKISSLEYDVMAGLSEITGEYLKNTKKPEAKTKKTETKENQLKKVTVE
jgi:hypothetical protein